MNREDYRRRDLNIALRKRPSRRVPIEKRKARVARTMFEIAEEAVALEHYTQAASSKRTQMYALGAKQALEWLFQPVDPMNPTRMLTLLDLALKRHRARPRLDDARPNVT